MNLFKLGLLVIVAVLGFVLVMSIWGSRNKTIPGPHKAPPEGFAYIANDGSLWKADWNGHNKQQVSEAGDTIPSAGAASWLGTENTLFFRTSTGVLESWSNGNRTVHSLPDPDCRFPNSPTHYYVSYLVCFSDTNSETAGRPMYAVRPDGGERLDISSNADPNLWSWSSDGQRLVFVENPRNDGVLTGDVYVWDSQTFARVPIGTFSGLETLRGLPGDAFVYAVALLQNVQVDAATGSQREVWPRPAAVLDSCGANGGYAVVNGDTHGRGILSFVNPWTTQAFPIETIDTVLPPQLEPGFHASWHDDCDYLAFSAVTDGPGNKANIYAFDRMAGQAKEMFSDVDADSVILAYSSDKGRLLIGFRGDDGRRVIYVANKDGSDAREVAEGTPIAQPWLEIFCCYL